MIRDYTLARQCPQMQLARREVISSACMLIDAGIAIQRGRILEMPTYYLYALAADGRIRRRIDFKCATDSEAIEVAKAHKREHGLELWHESRCLLKLPAPEAE